VSPYDQSFGCAVQHYGTIGKIVLAAMGLLRMEATLPSRLVKWATLQEIPSRIWQPLSVLAVVIHTEMGKRIMPNVRHKMVVTPSLPCDNSVTQLKKKLTRPRMKSRDQQRQRLAKGAGQEALKCTNPEKSISNSSVAEH
jgi:hypothetical protein